jgi:hypothetical protein
LPTAINFLTRERNNLTKRFFWIRVDTFVKYWPDFECGCFYSNDMPKSYAVMFSSFAARLVCLVAFVSILEDVARYHNGTFKLSGRCLGFWL